MKTSKTRAVALLPLLLAVLSLPTGASAQDGASGTPQDARQFSAALESQLACGQTPDPARAVGALRGAGVIARRNYLNYDSFNYFRVRKPLAVWGLRAVSVFGYANDPHVFERGPGTSPPVTLGVVVPYTVARVRSKLAGLGLPNVKVRRAQELEIPGWHRRGRALAEIYCEEP